MLREELSTRPHELVGAAALAAESGSIPTIAGRTVARRAATVLTHKAEQAGEAEDAPVAAEAPPVDDLSVAAAVAGGPQVGLWLGYAWTQTRYYVGEYDSRVAIFNGVSQRLGPIQLSTLEAVTDIRMDSLPEFSQQRVRQTVPADDLYDAQRIVKNLELTGTTSPEEDCVASSAAPTPPASPTPAARERPTATPTATPSPAPGSPTPTPSPTVPCEAAK